MTYLFDGRASLAMPRPGIVAITCDRNEETFRIEVDTDEIHRLAACVPKPKET